MKTENAERRAKRQYTDEFKRQMVELQKNGKARGEIIREYDLTASAFDKWVKQSEKSGSFRAVDNRTEAENELIRLQKENAKLKMEVDILKQAALILGRK